MLKRNMALAAVLASTVSPEHVRLLEGAAKDIPEEVPEDVQAKRLAEAQAKRDRRNAKRLKHRS